MPWMPKSHYARSYKRQNSARRYAEYDARRARDPQLTAFYSSSAWRSLRRLKLRNDPVCEHCREAAAVDAHHVVPVKQDMGKALEYSNLMSVCRSCHQIVEQASVQHQMHPQVKQQLDSLTVASKPDVGRQNDTDDIPHPGLFAEGEKPSVYWVCTPIAAKMAPPPIPFFVTPPVHTSKARVREIGSAGGLSHANL